VRILIAALVLATAGLAQAQDGPWIISTDYEVFGQIESFQKASPWNPSGSLSTTPSDAVGRHHDGRVYVVGRGGSNLIRVHDAQNGFALLREFSVGAGRNPQDIVLDDQGRAWVPCYDDDVLLQVDVQSGTVVAEYSTAAYADADGLPETGWAEVFDGRLYVTCQNLDRDNWYSPTGPGRLLVFDLTTLQWEAPIQLVAANPYSRIRIDDQDRLLVGCAGYWALNDAGVEAVDPATGMSLGYVATEAQLGGDVLNVVATGAGELHVLISNSSFATAVKRFAGGSATTVVSTAGYDLADIAFDGDFQLYVADRTLGAFGIRVFDTATGGELTTQPIATLLSPYSFVLPSKAGPTPVPLAGLPGALQLGLPYPNPCNPRSEVELTGAANATVRVSVHDLRGRRVTQTLVRTDADGKAVVRFNGVDTAGRALAAGAYRIVAEGGGGFAARTVMLVK